MPTISSFNFSIRPPPSLSTPRLFPSTSPSILRKFPNCPNFFSSIPSPKRNHFQRKSSEKDAALSDAEDEWLQKLPEKNQALYSHSLPCVEAWLKSLGFHQSRDDRAVWFVEKPDWHAQLSLDSTDLYIRKSVFRRCTYTFLRTKAAVEYLLQTLKSVVCPEKSLCKILPAPNCSGI